MFVVSLQTLAVGGAAAVRAGGALCITLNLLAHTQTFHWRIKGVQFEVRHMNGAYVGTYTTGSNGRVYITGLEDGWYTVTEIEAADGYLLDTTPYNVEVNAGTTATLTVKNTLASSILIHKVDSVTGKGIYGVQFLVSDSLNNPIGVYTSDQNGYVFIDKELTDGKYYIREIQAAEGYLIDDTVMTFYVKYGGDLRLWFTRIPETPH